MSTTQNKSLKDIIVENKILVIVGLVACVMIVIIIAMGLALVTKTNNIFAVETYDF